MHCWPFHDRGRYHIETSSLICGANQWTGFYMITASVMKGLKVTVQSNEFAIIVVNYPFKHQMLKVNNKSVFKVNS